MVKCPVVVDISIRWGWGWWCVGQWRKKESRDPTRQARTGNSPRTWPPNRHLNARPATVLVAVNRILPSVCLASLLFQDQPLLIGGGGGRIDNQTFPKISEDAVDAPWHGWSAPRRGTRWRGCTRASMTFSTRLTATSTDRSALQVRLRALFVPSDRNRPPRGRPRGCYLGRSGSGEAVEASGRSEWIHQGTRDRSERSTSPDPLGPMDTSSTSRGSLRGRGRP